MKGLFKTLKNTIYVPECMVCGSHSDEGYICPSCMANIHILASDVSARIKKNCSSLYAVTAYEGPLLSIVHQFKYGKNRAAEAIITRLILDNLKNFRSDVDVIVPVPLSARRYFGRGYNQSHLIAGILSKFYGKPRLKRAVVKSRHTERQVGKSFEERKENLRRAFKRPRLFADNVEGLNILLVDDVVTSGATLDECAAILKKSGANRVEAFVLAKTL